MRQSDISLHIDADCTVTAEAVDHGSFTCLTTTQTQRNYSYDAGKMVDEVSRTRFFFNGPMRPLAKRMEKAINDFAIERAKEREAAIAAEASVAAE